MVFSGKRAVFGQSAYSLAKLVVFLQSECDRAKVVVFLQSGVIHAEW